MAELCKTQNVIVTSKSLPTPANTPTPIDVGGGAPSDGDGNDGFFYIDTDTGDFYQKQSGSWVLLLSIIGPSGDDGTDGIGWTGASYNASTGIITFTSDDGLGFTTGDIRGPQGAQGDSAYEVWLDQGNVGTPTDFLNDLVGAKGDKGDTGDTGPGWTGGSYNGLTGIVTFTSDDGLWFSTGDLRGAKGDTGDTGPQGDGFTGGSYNAGTGVATFTSDDGLGFSTGDLRGADGALAPGGASGSIQFNDGSSDITGNTNLHWDDVNERLGVGTNSPGYNMVVVGQGSYTDLVLTEGGMIRLDAGSLVTGSHPFIGSEETTDASSPAYQTAGDNRNLAIGGKNGVRLHNLDSNTSMLLDPDGFVIGSGFFLRLPGGTEIVFGNDLVQQAREAMSLQINNAADKAAEFTIKDSTTTVFVYSNVTDDFQMSPNGTDALNVNASRVYIQNGVLMMDSATKTWEITIDDTGTINTSEVV